MIWTTAPAIYSMITGVAQTIFSRPVQHEWIAHKGKIGFFTNTNWRLARRMIKYSERGYQFMDHGIGCVCEKPGGLFDVAQLKPYLEKAERDGFHPDHDRYRY